MIDNLIQEIDRLYESAKASLLDHNNYDEDVELLLVQLQLMIIDKSISSPINRITFLRWFICNDESFTDKMYPLAFLKVETIEYIQSSFNKVSELYNCCVTFFNRVQNYV